MCGLAIFAQLTLSLLLFAQLTLSLLLFAGLDVTRWPEGESVSLDTDGRPLILSYIVCGTRHDLERFQFKITVSQDGIGGGDVKPQLNAPLIRDATAEARGISASLWNVTSPDYEMCNEVPIRVWTDHSKVEDSTIELKLGIKVGRIPEVYRGGKFRLVRNPEPATPIMTTQASVTTQASMTTDSELTRVPYIVVSSTMESPSKAALENPTRDDLLDCKCFCDPQGKDQH